MALTALILALSVAVVMVWLSWRFDDVARELSNRVEDLQHQVLCLEDTITDHRNDEEQS